MTNIEAFKTVQQVCEKALQRGLYGDFATTGAVAASLAILETAAAKADADQEISNGKGKENGKRLSRSGEFAAGDSKQ